MKIELQLGMIKKALHAAPETAKLLAYPTLCRPLLEYADTQWTRMKKAMPKHRNGSKPSYKVYKGQTWNHGGLKTTLHADTRGQAQKKTQNPTTNEDSVRQGKTMTTRAAIRGKPASIYASTNLLP